jgi:hypothetical protein
MKEELEISVRRCGAMLLGGFLAAACGGSSPGTGPGTGGTPDGGAAHGGAGGTAGTSGAGGARAACESTLNGATRTGTATVTSGASTETMTERLCETLRGADGSVVGWGAYFGPLVTGKAPSKQPYIKVVVAGSYTGDGTYGNIKENTPSGLQGGFELSAGTGQVFGTASAQETLVVSSAGKKFVFDAAVYGPVLAIHIEGQCDAADDTASTSGSPSGKPAPGTAQVIDALGALHVYDCLTCDYVASQLSMRAPTVKTAGIFGQGLHTYFTLSAPNTSGTFTGSGGEFDWQSPGVSTSGGGDSIQVDSMAPFSGSFKWNQTSTSGRKASGAFSCPAP